MSAPRLDINLDKISHNARMLVEDLGVALSAPRTA